MPSRRILLALGVGLLVCGVFAAHQANEPLRVAAALELPSRNQFVVQERGIGALFEDAAVKPPSHFQTIQLSGAGRVAFSKLWRARTVTTAHVSPSGEVPETFLLFGRLRAEQSNAEAFDALTRSPVAAARVYGLLGLHVTDKVRYAVTLKRLQADQARASTLFGCVGSDVPVSELVDPEREWFAALLSEYKNGA